MTEWTIVVVLIAMLGFAGTILAFAEKISKPLEKLNISMVELSSKLNGLTERIDRDGLVNEREHQDIWGEVDSHGKAIQDHETRLCVIEKGGEK